ncbi:unnamed protein product, partial [Discosporangium mesarthrocarpum]
MSVDVTRGEHFCPLCKSLSNILVPHVPPSTHASALVKNHPHGPARSPGQGQGKWAGPASRVLSDQLSSAEGLADWLSLPSFRRGGSGRGEDLSLVNG